MASIGGPAFSELIRPPPELSAGAIGSSDVFLVTLIDGPVGGKVCAGTYDEAIFSGDDVGDDWDDEDRPLVPDGVVRRAWR